MKRLGGLIPERHHTGREDEKRRGGEEERRRGREDGRRRGGEDEKRRGREDGRDLKYMLTKETLNIYNLEKQTKTKTWSLVDRGDVVSSGPR